MQSRYYNPQWGRFLNADDMSVVQAAKAAELLETNLFAYCCNNPITRVDETGYGMRYAYAGSVPYYDDDDSMVSGFPGVVAAAAVSWWYYAQKSKSKNPDPYARPNQKKQGRDHRK